MSWPSADHRWAAFRTFLRTDCGFFLSHTTSDAGPSSAAAVKIALAIDARDAEGRYLREPVDIGDSRNVSSTGPGP